MSEPAAALDPVTMRCGLLLESAQLHERTAGESLERLHAHTRDLDTIVRDEIRRTLIDELKMLSAEVATAVGALRAARRTLRLRLAGWIIGLAVATAAVPGAFAWWLLPSVRQIGALRAERDALRRNVAALVLRGAGVDWRLCGTARRLCVRIARGTPAFGPHADYRLVVDR
ncbi:MAG TPA: hypothetical protein VMU86_03970 [Steroidobacteraceae bacterium]|nr:hypothetical protein [Steroidobacteraceae bacterium]